MEFDEELYHRINLVETAFFVLKRKYGEELKARKYRNQVKEIVYVTQVRISTEPFPPMY